MNWQTIIAPIAVRSVKGFILRCGAAISVILSLLMKKRLMNMQPIITPIIIPPAVSVAVSSSFFICSL